MEDLLQELSFRLIREINAVQQKYILHQVDTNTLFEDLLDLLLDCTGSEYGIIGFYPPHPKKASLKILAASEALDLTKGTIVSPKPIPEDGPPTDLLSCLRATSMTGSPSFANYYSKDDFSPEERHAVMLQNFLSCPVPGSAKNTGAFGIANRQGGFSQAWIDILQPFQATLSTFIQKHYQTAGKSEVLAERPHMQDDSQGEIAREGHWTWNPQSRQFQVSSTSKQTEERKVGSLRKLIRQYIHPEDTPKILQGLRDQDIHRTRFSTQCRLRLYSEEYRWYRLTVRIQHDEQQQISTLGGTLRDIHEFKAGREKNKLLHQESRSLNQKMKSNRMELRRVIQDTRNLRSRMSDNNLLLTDTLDPQVAIPETEAKDKTKEGKGEQSWLKDEKLRLSEELYELAEVFENNLNKSAQLRQQLEERDLLLKKVIDSYADIFVVFDKNLCVKYVNQTTLDFLGLPEDQVVGMTEKTFLPPELVSVYQPKLKLAYDTKQEQSFEARLSGTKTTKDVLIRYLPQLDNSGDVEELLAISFDISKQKKQEQEIRKNQEQYHYLFRHSPLPMWIYDLQTLRFMDVNDAAIHSYGWSRKEFLEMRILDIQPQDEQHTLRSYITRRISKYNNSGIWTHQKKDGRQISVEITSHEFKFYGRKARIVLANDVTERLQAEQMLRKSQANLKATLDNGLVSLALLDKEGRIVLTDQQYAENARIRAGKTMDPGTYFNEIVPKDLLSSFQNNFSKVLQGEKVRIEKFVSFSPEYQYWLDIAYNPVLNADSEVTGVVFSSRDITTKKQAQLKLAESEANLKAIFDATTHSYFLVDKNCKILKFNRMAAQMVKTIHKATLREGDNMLDYADPQLVDDFKVSLQQALQGIRVSKQRHANHPNSTRWYDVQYLPVLRNNQVYAVAFVSADITDRKQAEEEVRNYADRLNDILENITDGFFTVNRDWRLTRVNQVFEKTLKRKREELIGEVVWDVFPEAVKLKFYEEYSKTMDHGVEVHFEEYFPPLDIWFEAHAYPAEDGISVYFRDITSRKKYEDEIHKLSMVASKTEDTVIITNARREIEWVNEGFSKLTGYAFEEVIGRNPGHFLQGPETGQRTVDRIRNKLNQKESLTEELVNYRKDGSKYWIRMDITPILDEDGVTQKFIAIQSNITDQKNAELEKAQLVEELLSKNKSLEEYAFITSHNLRAPIAHILGLTYLFNQENPADPFHATLIQQLGTAAENLDTVIMDITNLLSIRNNNVNIKETIPIDEVLQAVMEQMRGQIEDTQAVIKYDLQIDTEAYGIKKYFQSILMHLISNAIRYRHPNRIPEITLSAHQKQDQLCFTVKDNGLGIDLDKYGSRLFSLYNRFHSHVEGKGIGLNLVKLMAEAMGGTVEVESEVGKGSTFQLCIPLRRA
jgi:PAS domain S-box-containing protein